MLHKMKPAAIGAQRASAFVNWQVGGAEDNDSQVSKQIIRAELIGDHGVTAVGQTIRSATPVLTLCRNLIERGHDPATKLEAYRGDTLALVVRSIGEGTRLEVNAKGTGFITHRAVLAASLIRQNRRGAS